MSQQLNFDSHYDPEYNANTYSKWILTVGQLRETLATWSDDTLVKISFRGKTPMGVPIDVSMPIQVIGNGCEFIDGEKKNLVYISGFDN